MIENPYQSPEAESRPPRRRPGSLISKSAQVGVGIVVGGMYGYFHDWRTRPTGMLLIEIGLAILAATLVAWLLVKLTK